MAHLLKSRKGYIFVNSILLLKFSNITLKAVGHLTRANGSLNARNGAETIVDRYRMSRKQAGEVG